MKKTEIQIFMFLFEFLICVTTFGSSITNTPTITDFVSQATIFLLCSNKHIKQLFY